MTFHLTFVHIIFSSGSVSEWPPFGKNLITRLPICSLNILNICNIVPVLVLMTGVWIVIAFNSSCPLYTFYFHSFLVFNRILWILSGNRNML